MYNSLEEHDVRLELAFPGKMEVYSVSETSRAYVSDAEWIKTYVFSILRAFSPLLGPGVRILPELSTRVQYRYFLQCALALIKNGVKVEKVNDSIKTSQNYLAGRVMKYLLQKSKLEDCKEFLESRKIYE